MVTLGNNLEPQDRKLQTLSLRSPHPLKVFHTKRITTDIFQNLKEIKCMVKEVLFQVFIFMMKA